MCLVFRSSRVQIPSQAWVISMDGYKICSTCRRTLPLTCFHKDSCRPDGKQRLCKNCKLKFNKNNSSNAYKKYSQSKKGKARNAKSRARRRSYDFVKLAKNPFDKSEKIEWHHVSNIYVVALPRDLHQSFHSPSSQVALPICLTAVRKRNMG